MTIYFIRKGERKMKMKKIGLAALAAVMVASVASCQPKEGVGKYTYN